MQTCVDVHHIPMMSKVFIPGVTMDLVFEKTTGTNMMKSEGRLDLYILGRKIYSKPCSMEPVGPVTERYSVGDTLLMKGNLPTAPKQTMHTSYVFAPKSI